MPTLVLSTRLLKVDDLVTEKIAADDRTERNVLITKIDSDVVWYREDWNDVFYVTGTDLNSHKPVKWMAVPRRNWTASRP